MIFPGPSFAAFPFPGHLQPTEKVIRYGPASVQQLATAILSIVRAPLHLRIWQHLFAGHSTFPGSLLEKHLIRGDQYQPSYVEFETC